MGANPPMAKAVEQQDCSSKGGWWQLTLPIASPPITVHSQRREKQELSGEQGIALHAVCFRVRFLSLSSRNYKIFNGVMEVSIVLEEHVEKKVGKTNTLGDFS